MAALGPRRASVAYLLLRWGFFPGPTAGHLLRGFEERRAAELLEAAGRRRGRLMVKGPRGEKRPADVNARAVMVARIAVGEIEEPVGKAPNRAKGGRKGASARSRLPISSGRRSRGLRRRPAGRKAGSLSVLRKIITQRRWEQRCTCD